MFFVGGAIHVINNNYELLTFMFIFLFQRVIQRYTGFFYSENFAKLDKYKQCVLRLEFFKYFQCVIEKFESEKFSDELTKNLKKIADYMKLYYNDENGMAHGKKYEVPYIDTFGGHATYDKHIDVPNFSAEHLEVQSLWLLSGKTAEEIFMELLCDIDLLIEKEIAANPSQYKHFMEKQKNFDNWLNDENKFLFRGFSFTWAFLRELEK